MRDKIEKLISDMRSARSSAFEAYLKQKDVSGFDAARGLGALAGQEAVLNRLKQILAEEDKEDES